MDATNDPIVYTFTGGYEPDGSPSQWYEGVPATDLTQAEFDALDPASQRSVAAGMIYTATGDAAPTDPAKMTRAELDAYAAARGVESPESLPNKEAVLAAIAAMTAV